MKKKLALVDHSYHRKTNATSFLIELLKKYFQVKIIWDETWKGGEPTDLGQLVEQGYETIILFQQISCRKRELMGINQRNLILIPMYDFSRGSSFIFWKKFRYAKIINFSRDLHMKLEKYGLMSKYFQYFPPASDFKPSRLSGDTLSGFLWQRTDRITWNHIRELIKNTDFNKFHIHAAVDPPGYKLILPSEEEKKRYNITISNWFPNREDYLKILSKTNVYFAPRLYEGIGMSILEAMSMGKFVVAPDYPTMNEYIIHGKTGLLYDPKNIKPLDFSNLEEICVNANKYIAQGHKVWLKAEAELIDFIQLPFKKSAPYPLPPVPEKFFLSVKEMIKENFPRMANVLIKLRKKFRRSLS